MTDDMTDDELEQFYWDNPEAIPDSESQLKMSNTRRKPKTGAKAVAHSCRNNGTCEYCKGNRLHKHKREESKANEKLYGI